MTRSTLSLLLALLLATAPALAQDAASANQHMAALKAQLAPGKQTFIARQMALSPAEEAGFWPLYDEHQSALAELQQRRRANAAAYARAAGSLDDDTAEDLAEEAVDIETEEAELMDRTYSRLSRAISPAKALKFLQLEAKLSALLRYELAATIPTGE